MTSFSTWKLLTTWSGMFHLSHIQIVINQSFWIHWLMGRFPLCCLLPLMGPLNIMLSIFFSKKKKKHRLKANSIKWALCCFMYILIRHWLWSQAIGRQSNTTIYRESRSPCWGWTTMCLQHASQRNSHHFIGRWRPNTAKLIVNLSSFVEYFYCLELNIYTL